MRHQVSLDLQMLPALGFPSDVLRPTDHVAFFARSQAGESLTLTGNCDGYDVAIGDFQKSKIIGYPERKSLEVDGLDKRLFCC